LHELVLPAGLAIALPILMENTSEMQNKAGIIRCLFSPLVDGVLAAAIVESFI
jgi:hypothetical protein